MEKRTCTIEGCDRAPRRKSAEWCNTHYFRWYRNGDPERLARKGQRKPCKIEGCDKDARSNEMCRKHDSRFVRHGDPDVVLIPHWVGDAVGYRGMHTRLRKTLGAASNHQCIHCTEPAAHWAYDHGDPDEKRSPEGLPFSTDPSHYQPMCVPCHNAFDQGRIVLTAGA